MTGNARGAYRFIKAGNLSEWNDVWLGVMVDTPLTTSIGED
jgi:hypothetical protein